MGVLVFSVESGVWASSVVAEEVREDPSVAAFSAVVLSVRGGVPSTPLADCRLPSRKRSSALWLGNR